MREATRVRLMERAAERGGAYLGEASDPNARRRLRFRCAAGHRFETTADVVLRHDSWCPRCAGNARGTLEELRTWAASFGGVCLSTRYVNSRTRVRFRCDRGHEFSLEPREIRAGRGGCRECRELDRGRARLDAVREALSRRGYELLSDVWPGASGNVHVRDPEGRERSLRAGRIVPGRRGVALRTLAAKGRRERSISPGPMTHRRPVDPPAKVSFPRSSPPAARLETLRHLVAERHDGTLLSGTWEGLQHRYAFRCRVGHRFDARASNVAHRGSWCPVCAGNAPRDLARFEAFARERGGELLSRTSPIGPEARLEFRCARGHRFSLHLRTLGGRQDGWCAICARIDAREREHRAMVRVATRAGYTVLTPRIESRRQKVSFRCPAGHMWACRSYDFRVLGTRCGECFRASTSQVRRVGQTRRAGRRRPVHGERQLRRVGRDRAIRTTRR